MLDFWVKNEYIGSVYSKNDEKRTIQMNEKKIIKKIVHTVCFLSMFLLLNLVFTKTDVVFAADFEKRVDAVSYKMNLTLDTDKNCLTEVVTMKIQNNTDETISELCIRDMTPAILKFNKKEYATGNRNKKTEISSIKVKGSKKKLGITYKKNKSVIMVKLDEADAIKPGGVKTITVNMKTDIPNRQDRFGYQKTKDGKVFALSLCFPYLADNLNGKWETDPFFDDGESRSWDLADYDVTLKVPKEYQVAATGSSKRKNDKVIIKAENVRDFAIVACNFMKKDTFTVKGIKVNSYYMDGKYSKEYRKLAKMVAKDSIKIFTEQVGKYPYDELDMVPCLFGFAFGGMEYPGLIMINYSSYYAGAYFDGYGVSEKVSHEIGHQWFYAAVGNREYTEGWIDEGFTTYLEQELYTLSGCKSFEYARKLDDIIPTVKKLKKQRDELISYAREDFKNIYLNVAPNKYPKGQSYGAAEYEGGYMFLQEVRLQLGNKTFKKFLKDYYETYYMKVVTTEDVVNFIKTYDNSEKMNEIIDFYIKK